jgi:ABC-type lipoprotein export system ATPase subunit
MSALLEMGGVCKSFGGRRVLGPVSFVLAPGECCAVTGPSGSGKSTFLHIAGCLEAADAGEMRFAGERVEAGDRALRTRLRRERIGMIFQSVCLLPQRSVMENVLFRARYTGHRRRELSGRAEALLERFGLTERAGQKARLLSGGEAQRVAIARALLVEPALLLADEPTGNLDEASAGEVMRALADCAGRGIGVLLVTHNLSLVREGWRRVDCRGGRFAENGVCASETIRGMEGA